MTLNCSACTRELTAYDPTGAGPVNVSDPQGDTRFCNWDCVKKYAATVGNDLDFPPV